MRITLFIITLLLSCFELSGQATEKFEKAFKNQIDSYLSFSVPVISAEALAKNKNAFLIIDSREKEEYDVGHIKGAIYSGYDDLDLSILDKVDKDQKIAVYCSIGYRSEKVCEKIVALGYTRVYNVYGSIFQWVNEGNSIVDKEEKVTDQLHTYNRSWSKWVSNPKVKKTW